MTTIGRMRHRIILEEPVDVPDDAGGFSRSWQTARSLWASIEPKSAAAYFMAGQSGITVTHEIIVRAVEGVTLLHRFRLGARIFEIRAVRETDASGAFLTIQAEEQKP